MSLKNFNIRNIAVMLNKAGMLRRLYLPRPKDRIREFLTDTRSLYLTEGVLFAALRTTVADGHRFIADMLRAGVRNFLVENIPEVSNSYHDANFLQVSSVADALAFIGCMAAKQLTGRKILITGSYGKTITKELIYNTLYQNSDEQVFRSPRSWNSFIGIVSSLTEALASDIKFDTIILEAGIDGPHQAEKITGKSGLLRNPDIGVLTPVNTEHDEAFSSHKAKIIEKLRLLRGADKLVYDTSDPAVDDIVKSFFLGSRTELVPVKGETSEETFRLLAEAVCGCPAETPFVSTRFEICETFGGNTVIHDYFTPDLRSLRGALDMMRRYSTPGGNGVLIVDKMHGAPEVYDQARRMAEKFGVQTMIVADPSSDAERLARISDGLEFTDSHILIFGERTGNVKPYAEALESAGHDTTLAVDLDAMVHNYNYFRRLLPSGTGIIAMVKASAYGMGAVETGKTLQSRGAAYLAVAVVDEAVALRRAGITMPVMVLNPITNRYSALFAHKIEPAIFSLGEMQRLISEATAAGISGHPVHIKLDTGMHRVGFTAGQLPDLLNLLSTTDAVRVESVFSHLATADCLDMDYYTRSQLRAFSEMASVIERHLGHPVKRHILNTAGMMRFTNFGPYQMARLGIGLYGISPYPCPEAAALRPVASFRTHIISVKHWPAGTPIGYGCKGHTIRTSVIATIPVGYADGIDRHLGRGAASFTVNGVPCPTIGNICMDLCMIDITDVPEAGVGTPVEIFGADTPIEALAKVLDTIPYEILTSVSQRVRRTYFVK